VCLQTCHPDEPELERQFQYYQTANYTASRLLTLCQRRLVPLLIRISKSRVYWKKCGEGRITGSHEFLVVRRVLFALAKDVDLPDVAFALDPSDFSRPLASVEGASSPQWNFFEPAIVRFVGDAASPALLFPTKAFVKTTGLCGIEKDFAGAFVPCSNIPATPWASKSPVVFFRGSPTGIPLDRDHEHFIPRPAFSERFHSRPGYDVAFVKDATPPYRPSDFLARHRWVDRVPKQDYAKYKYLVSMDGHSASWGLIERLATGSLVFKQESAYREHYYVHLKPFVHLIPLDPGFANMESARQWALEHDAEARAMAQRTLELVRTRFRTQDTWCYVLRLILELSRRFTNDGTDILTNDLADWRPLTRADVDEVVKD